MIDLIQLFDQQTILFVNQFHHDLLDTFFYYFCKSWIWIPLYIYVIWQLKTTYGTKSGLIAVAFLASAVGLNDYSCNKIIKPIAARQRPFHTEEIHHKLHYAKELGITETKMHEKGNDYSFYSSHAGNFATLTVFLLLALPRHKTLKTIFIFSTILISFGRIYLCLHFPTDVITGLLSGAILAYIFHKIFQFVIK
ncbi:MAG: phosphatase PAP2 family protein [Bacteroidota bacterium]